MHVRPDNLQQAELSAAAERLREALQKTGGSKRAAELSKVPLGTLNGYLAGGEMKASNVVRLARACGVSVEWLLTGGGLEPPWRRKFDVVGSGHSERQAPLIAPKIETHWLAKAIEIVDALGGARLSPRERAARIAQSYELMTAPEADIPPLPVVPPRRF